jgi:hypothetical protein
MRQICSTYPVNVGVRLIEDGRGHASDDPLLTIAILTRTAA